MDHCEIIEKALIHIEDNLDQPLSLESVADRFNLSKYYFHRLFSAMTGSALNPYVRSRRLNASIGLIRSGRLTLTDIAGRLSFGTPSSFTRAFKQEYGISPSALKIGDSSLLPSPVPPVVQRPFKNLNGDIITDFTLTAFEAVRLSGIAFEIDLAQEDYKEQIRAHSDKLMQEIAQDVQGPCYVVYSNCQPGSTKFKALFGIPSDIRVEKPYYFTVDVPPFFSARFKYAGDLLEIGDVLKTDYARFLKISRLETGESPIELVQYFDDVHRLDAAYSIYAPIQKLPIDADSDAD